MCKYIKGKIEYFTIIMTCLEHVIMLIDSAKTVTE